MPLASGRWVMGTPEGDRHVGRLSDYRRVIKVWLREGLPVYTTGRKIVGFDAAFLDANLERWIAEAKECQPAVDGDLPAPQDAEDETPPPDGPHAVPTSTGAGDPVWLSMESRGGHKAGCPVTTAGKTLHIFGDRAVLVEGFAALPLAMAGSWDPPASWLGGSEGDLRTLSVEYGHRRARYRDFKEGVEQLPETTLEDFGFTGPRSLRWLVEAIVRQNITPRMRHEWWKSALRLAPYDEGVEEHGMVSEVIEVALTYVQLNGSELRCLEHLCRRYQLWEAFYADALEAADHGSTRSLGVALVSPELEEWVAGRLQKEAAILKERRKAREEGQLGRGPAPAVEQQRGAGQTGEPGNLRGGRSTTRSTTP